MPFTVTVGDNKGFSLECLELLHFVVRGVGVISY